MFTGTVSTDCKGNLIGNISVVMDHDDLVEPQQADNLPGVYIPEPEDAVHIRSRYVR